MDAHAQQQAQRIDQEVPLASTHLLAPVVAARPPFRGLRTLAAEEGGARLRMPPRADPNPLAQGGIDSLPGAVITLLAEVVVDGLPGGEVMGQGAPGNPAP